MKSIRRLYFYLVAFISIEVVTWGLIGLLRSIIDDTVSGGAEALAQAIALILVGVPIFLIHWLWAQRASAREEEEKTAGLRAVFLYAILLATLIPVVQNVLAFINRSFIGVARIEQFRALVGGTQTLADNLIAIVMNLIVAAYFWNILRNEWLTLPDKESFSDVRRLYRYIWMLYGLLMVVFGGQQVLRFLFYIPGDVLGELGREVLINGLALLIVGTPVWFYTWRVVQNSLSDSAEMNSTLRLGILYLLALGGVITVVTAAWNVANSLFTSLLGGMTSFRDFIRDIGGPISTGVPLGMVWAYYGYWLRRHIEATGDKVREAGMKRLYFYILAFIGLAVSFVGVNALFSFIIEVLTNSGLLSRVAIRETLTTSISSLVVGLPLWLMTWRPMQAGALAKGELGNHARRSVIRKFYLYLALFASVIGGMGTAVGLVYELISTLLSGNVGSDFLNSILNMAQLLFLFGVVLIYHLKVLRADGESISDALAEKQSEFSILVIDSENGFADSVRAALTKLESKVHITVTTSVEKPQGEFKAVVLSGGLAVNAPEWIRSFSGSRVVIQNEAKNIVWADDAVQAAQSVQMLAEGQEVRLQRTGRSPWMIVVYIFAALFGLILLLILFGLAMSLLVG
ncbi:MAG: hypothetical protein HXY35_01175 [Chloroflexi bacterium]|nr:hypothetical protein [Chloroflexota bacterium]